MRIKLTLLKNPITDLLKDFEVVPHRLDKVIGDSILKDIERNFVTESVVPDGGSTRKKWKPTKDDSYIDRKGNIVRLHARRHKILSSRRMRLRRSFSVVRRGNKYIVLSGTAYARYHQEGTDRLPRRQMISTNRNLINRIKREIAKKLTSKRS